MSDNETDPGTGQRRRKWLVQLFDEYGKVQRLLPLYLLPSGIKYPEWLENVEREISLVLFPATSLKEAQVVTPSGIGAIMGQGCANGRWLMEWFDSAKQGALGEPETASDEAGSANDAELKYSVAVWCEVTSRCAKSALCSCVDQPYEDMRDFLLGFAKGFALKPATSSRDKRGTASLGIYLFLIVHWRLIERMSSIRELHESLKKALGDSQVGDQKRIGKICQRIGLSFSTPACRRRK